MSYNGLVEHPFQMPMPSTVKLTMEVQWMDQGAMKQLEEPWTMDESIYDIMQVNFITKQVR